jgi:hypothetical protein
MGRNKDSSASVAWIHMSQQPRVGRFHVPVKTPAVIIGRESESRPGLPTRLNIITPYLTACFMPSNSYINPLRD